MLAATAGWTFQTTNAFTVTELGCFANVFEDNPGVTSVQVGLWDDSGSLLASNSITPASTLFDQTRYESITPVSLSPGQVYHLGVYYSGAPWPRRCRPIHRRLSVCLRRRFSWTESPSQPTASLLPWPRPEPPARSIAGPNFRFLVHADRSSIQTLDRQPGPPFLVHRVSGLHPAIRARAVWPSWGNAGLTVTTWAASMSPSILLHPDPNTTA